MFFYSSEWNNYKWYSLFFQVLAIAEEASNKDFVNHILPTLKPVMKITDPIQVNTKKKNYRICSRKMHLVDLFYEQNRGAAKSSLFAFL